MQLTTLLNGTAERTLTTPASPSVIGIELIAQAITYDGDALQLSNSLRSWVR